MTGTHLWLFFCAILVGSILIVFGGKKQRGGAAHRPKVLEFGYLVVLISTFGLFSIYMSFTVVMLIFVLITGVVCLTDKLVFSSRRSAGVQATHFINYCRGFFPVMLLVFLLRSFIVEPFQIPSSSMRPGLVVGDFILVNKFIYGLRVPVVNTVFVSIGQVARGDVVVFGFPLNPKINYIKRVIGLPGDLVEYREKRLTVNGQCLPGRYDDGHEYLDQDLMMVNAERHQETLGQRTYSVLYNQGSPPVALNQVDDFPFRNHCRYDDNGFVCKVPPRHYFMLGDNRDNSLDSRYWGFVDDKLMVGKAFMIWMNFSDLSRIWKSIY